MSILKCSEKLNEPERIEAKKFRIQFVSLRVLDFTDGLTFIFACLKTESRVGELSFDHRIYFEPEIIAQKKGAELPLINYCQYSYTIRQIHRIAF